MAGRSRITALAALAALSLGSCEARAAPPASAAVGGAAGAGLKVATFGTSLTSNGGWQRPLAEAIEACTGRPAEVLNFGKAGAASDWGVEAVGEVAASRPDVVLLEFAVNDAAVNNFIRVGASVRNMRRIVEDIRRARPDVMVYVMSMSPASGRRAWARPWRDSYEDAHRDLAAELGLRYIDHRPDWEKLGEDALDRAIADGVHPTPASATAIIVPNVMARFRDDGVIHCEADHEG